MGPLHASAGILWRRGGKGKADRRSSSVRSQKAAFAFHVHADAIAAIGEDETGDVIRVRALVRTDEDSADRCADQYVLSLFSRAQYRVQI